MGIQCLNCGRELIMEGDYCSPLCKIDKLSKENAKLKAANDKLQAENKELSDGIIIALDETMATRVLKSRIEELKAKVEEWDRLFADSGMDISPCMECGKDTLCLPDGMPICEKCAQKGD